MCTVTFIARRSGYALGMNRDEKLTRVRARPAARHRLGDGGALFPSEPNGGTWVGVNDSGATLALINWYSVAARVVGKTVSRGETVRSALHSESPAGVDAALNNLLYFNAWGQHPTPKAQVFSSNYFYSPLATLQVLTFLIDVLGEQKRARSAAGVAEEDAPVATISSS